MIVRGRFQDFFDQERIFGDALKGFCGKRSEVPGKSEVFGVLAAFMKPQADLFALLKLLVKVRSSFEVFDGVEINIFNPVEVV